MAMVGLTRDQLQMILDDFISQSVALDDDHHDLKSYFLLLKQLIYCYYDQYSSKFEQFFTLKAKEVLMPTQFRLLAQLNSTTTA